MFECSVRKMVEQDGFILGFTGKIRQDIPPSGYISLKAAGAGLRVFTLNQIHSSQVLVAEKVKEPAGDAIISFSGISLGVKTADCVPIAGVHPARGVTFAIHAGWRGIVKGVVRKTFEVLLSSGLNPCDFIIAVGPHICMEHYPVGDDVRKLILKHYPERVFKGNHLSLRQCVLFDMAEFGVEPSEVITSQLCTYETEDLASYRRDGRGCGRQITFVGKFQDFSARIAEKSSPM